MKVELLAPAGSMESLYAAINSGADAVYMGGSRFSARAYASNFDDNELKDAVDYAHLYGVKVYITINTLIKSNEMKEVIEYVKFLYEIGVDALIIQDLGAFYCIKKFFPKFELHASTQMTIHNGEGALFLKESGFSRIVLSRELSLNEIKYISKDLNIETEIFIHGALCICYSGQCLMSSLIGGRSGNRGRCAQPCRLPYTLINKSSGEEKSAYILSPKDMCTIDNIEDILESGAYSLKIEGRMKRPEYVAGVVHNYRKSIDKYYEQGKILNTLQSKKELLQLFNREGFSSAYLYSNEGNAMMAYSFPKNTGICIGKADKDLNITLEEDINKGDGIRNGEGGFTISKIILNGKELSKAVKGDRVKIYPLDYSKNDILFKTYDSNLMKYYEDYYKNPYYIKIDIDLDVYYEIDKPFKLKAYYHEKIYEVSGKVVQKALRRAVTKEKIEENLRKTKDTPFKIKDIKFVLYEEGFIPISAINALRRQLMDEILQDIIASYRRDYESAKAIELKEVLKIKQSENALKILKFMVTVSTRDQLKAALESEVEAIILNCFYRGYDALEEKEIKNISHKNLYLKIPNIIKEEFSEVCDFIERNEPYIKGIVTANLGIIRKYRGKINIIGDYKLNIFNKYALTFFKDYTYFNCLSLELNRKEIKELLKESNLPCQMLIYGRAELMVSEYCPIGSVMGGKSKAKKCSGECMRGEFLLKDRKNEKFVVKTDKFCRSYIYNSSPINLIDNKEDIESLGVNSFRMDFIDEDYANTKLIIEAALKGVWNEDFSEYTRGHYKRGVE